MMKNVLKFQHKNPDVFRACGIFKHELDSTMDKFARLEARVVRAFLSPYGDYRVSEGIEKVYNGLDERELTVLFVYLLRKELIMVSDIVADKIEDLDGDETIKPDVLFPKANLN